MTRNTNSASHLQHIGSYFTRHDPTEWSLLTFTTWCRNSPSQKFSRAGSIKNFFLQELKNRLELVPEARVLYEKIKGKTKAALESKHKRPQFHGSVHLHSRSVRRSLVSTRKQNYVNARSSRDAENPGNENSPQSPCASPDQDYISLPSSPPEISNVTLTSTGPPVPPVPEGLEAVLDARRPASPHDSSIPKPPEDKDISSDKLYSNFPEMYKVSKSYRGWLSAIMHTSSILRANLASHPHLCEMVSEGWYDANLWAPLVDGLWQLDPSMILCRKEIELLDQVRNPIRKYDGVFRYSTGIDTFDLGVIEVAPPSSPRKTMKADADFQKCKEGMGLILKNLLSRNALHEDDRSKVQVIGFCFWGWGCLAMRMWENDDGGFMLREEWLRISLTFDETKKTGFSVETTNLLKVLVGYWLLAKETARIVSVPKKPISLDPA